MLQNLLTEAGSISADHVMSVNHYRLIN